MLRTVPRTSASARTLRHKAGHTGQQSGAAHQAITLSRRSPFWISPTRTPGNLLNASSRPLCSSGTETAADFFGVGELVNASTTSQVHTVDGQAQLHQGERDSRSLAMLAVVVSRAILALMPKRAGRVHHNTWRDRILIRYLEPAASTKVTLFDSGVEPVPHLNSVQDRLVTFAALRVLPRIDNVAITSRLSQLTDDSSTASSVCITS